MIERNVDNTMGSASGFGIKLKPIGALDSDEGASQAGMSSLDIRL